MPRPRALTQLALEVDQFFVAGDRFRFHVSVGFNGDPPVPIPELGLVCQYRDVHGSIVAQPEVEFYEDDYGLGFVDLSPDLTRQLGITQQPLWGLKWLGWPRTLMYGRVHVQPEVVLEFDVPIEGLSTVVPNLAQLGVSV